MTPGEMAALHAAAMTVPRPWREAEIISLLAAPGAFALAESGGFAIGRVVVDEAELMTLAVDPMRRRRGIGRRLLSGYEDEAARRGAAISHLEVSAENRAAIALYESAGYALSGRRRGYYSAPDGAKIDALLYRKSLSGA